MKDGEEFDVIRDASGCGVVTWVEPDANRQQHWERRATLKMEHTFRTDAPSSTWKTANVDRRVMLSFDLDPDRALLLAKQLTLWAMSKSGCTCRVCDPESHAAAFTKTALSEKEEKP